MSETNNPRLVLLFCGKRKSGKDFLTEWLLNYLKSNNKLAVIIRLSGPIKECFSREHGLDLQQLLGDGGYKEHYRLKMVEWSEEIRNRDPGYFCRNAEEMYSAMNYPVWIVSDCRRVSDFHYFESNYTGRTKRIRVMASENTRANRGFVFQTGIDDAETECGLDCQETDFALENESHPENVLNPVLNYLEQISCVL